MIPVVEREGGAVDPDEPATAAHEVGDGTPLRVRHRKVAVREHHEAVELRQVLSREEREVEALGVLQVALHRRDLEARLGSP